MELQPFGIAVGLLLPGAIWSSLTDKAPSWVDQEMQADSLYRSTADGIRGRVKMTQQESTPTKDRAASAVAPLTRSNARSIVWVWRGSSVPPWLKRLVPDWLLDRIRTRRFGLDAMRARPG